MGKYLENWLTIWKKTEAPGIVYKDLLEIYRERYETDLDLQCLMRAYAFASTHKFDMPTWVIEGLDSHFRRCRFFTEASKEKHFDSKETMERAGLKDYELVAKILKDEIEWCLKSGKWLPEETQAVWRSRVKDNGLIWIDKEDITYYTILENLDDLLFPESAIIELEKKHGLGVDEERKALLPCKPGTKWEDITITLLSDDTDAGPGLVRIRTPEGESRFTYHQLGFQDNRSPDRSTKLWALLKLFAKRTGYLRSDNMQFDRKLPDTAKRLNKHLQEVFGILESTYAGHYKKEKGYRTRIKFEDKTY